MKKTSPLRRLLAGIAGLAVGLAGTAALSTPAQATDVQQPPVNIEVTSTCDALSILVEYPADGSGPLELEIIAGPAIETVTLEPGDTHEASFFPRVSYQIFIDGALVDEGAWEDTGDCGEPTVLVDWEFHCDSITLEVTTPRTFEVVSITREDDETFDFALEPGVTTTLTILDATDDTVVVVTYDGDVVETIAWEEPEVCGQPATEDPSTEEPATGGGSGGADELPATGSPTLWLAGAAVALVAVGSGLYLLARRRVVGFTS